MNNSHLSSPSDLLQAVLEVAPGFSKKVRWMGRTTTLDRVFQTLSILLNEEDVMLEDIVEAF